MDMKRHTYKDSFILDYIDMNVVDAKPLFMLVKAEAAYERAVKEDSDNAPVNANKRAQRRQSERNHEQMSSYILAVQREEKPATSCSLCVGDSNMFFLCSHLRYAPVRFSKINDTAVIMEGLYNED